MMFLAFAGQGKIAKEWLSELVRRIDYTYKITRNFPVDTDTLDDLVELCFGEPPLERRKELMQTSWMLPLLAGWCVIFEDASLYAGMVQGQKEEGYPDVCCQLWHPVTEDFFDHLYFHRACMESGEAEAPIRFDEDMKDYRARMELIIKSDRHEVVESSPAYQAGLYGLDLIAMRHFRTPVPPMFWYQFVNSEMEDAPPPAS